MLHRFCFCIVLHCCVLTATPCTTFFIHHQGRMVFGRNYDWYAGSGMICTNQRGLYKTSFPAKDSKTISWRSKYGSISFNQYGKEFPTGGMNEKGLVVELMWLDGTEYPKPDQRPAIGVLQWIQYQLDNCSTVEDVIATDKQVRIVQGAVPLHYLVADATGQAASIEFLNGKLVVHRDKTMPFSVLTNDSYANSIASFAQRNPEGNNSLERFATACNMVNAIRSGADTSSLIQQSFEILNQVAQGEFTRWSIVYDITAKKIFFKTNENVHCRSLQFSDFDFACGEPAKILDINDAGEGDMKKLFRVYTPAMNEMILEKSLKQSSAQVNPTREQIRATLAYPNTIDCK